MYKTIYQIANVRIRFDPHNIFIGVRYDKHNQHIDINVIPCLTIVVFCGIKGKMLKRLHNKSKARKKEKRS